MSKKYKDKEEIQKLYYADGYTMQEIADIIGRDRRYVKRRLKKDMIFICEMCNHKFTNRVNYLRHIKSCDGGGTVEEKRPGPKNCKLCGRTFLNRENCKRHEFSCDGTGKVSVEKIKGPKTCIYCGKIFKNRENCKRHEVECGKLVGIDLQGEYDSGLSINDIADKYNASKKLIEKLVKNKRTVGEAYLVKREKNPDKYFYGGTKKFSRGEKVFKDMLVENYLDKKYNIIQQHNIFGYRLDFSFPDLKLDIEIDGMQHYTKDYNIKIDRKRNKILNENGWTVYRIASKDFLSRPKVVFNIFLDFLENFSEKSLKIYKYEGQIIDGDKMWYKDRVATVLNSTINFQHKGWSIKLGYILEITPSSALRWVQRNMPEFYKEKCWTPKMDYIIKNT